MRAAALVALAILALPVAAQGQASLAVSFQSPGQVSGDITVENATWLFLEIPAAARGVGQISWSSSEMTNWTQSAFVGVAADPYANGTMFASPYTPSSWTEAQGVANVEFGHKGTAHLIVEADAITVSTRLSSSLTTTDGRTERGVMPPSHYTNFMDRMPPATSVAIAGQNATNVRVSAVGVHYVQWAGAAAFCSKPVKQCPRGGGEVSLGPIVGPVSTSSRSIEELAMPTGNLSFSGSTSYLITGARQLDLAVAGGIRLPLASVSGECHDCNATGTLSASGRLTLSEMTSPSAGRLAASLGGNATSARIDEAPWMASVLHPGTALAIGAVGTAVLAIWIGWKIALWLVCQRPLENPRRRRIYTYIQANAGANFRKLAKDLGIFQGSLARHILVLRRADLIVERSVGNSKRYFENHGLYDSHWKETALLHNEDNRALLHAAIREMPCTQGAIVEAMQAHGWTRSTVQYRLNKLEATGLVITEQTGQQKTYTGPSELARSLVGAATQAASAGYGESGSGRAPRPNSR